MSTEPFGPSKKQTRGDMSYEDRREKLQEQLGFEVEAEPVQDAIPPESSWDADGNLSMYAQYWKRHPEKRPQPPPKREIRKIGQIAPGVDGGEYLAKLLEELKTLLANYAAFEEKVAALEARVNPDPCVESHGKNFRSVDGECVEISPDHAGQAPAPIPPSGMQKGSDIVNKILQKGGRLFTKVIAVDGGWTILSGRGT